MALAWRAFAALRARGKDPTAFPSTLARFAALAAAGGRRVGGPAASGDVMSPARRRAGARVVPLDDGGPAGVARLPSSPATRVPDAAAFRVDFPAWLGRLAAGKRAATVLLAAGYRPSEVAAGAGVTARRVSQVRRELAADWRRLHAGRGEARREPK